MSEFKVCPQGEHSMWGFRCKIIKDSCIKRVSPPNDNCPINDLVQSLAESKKQMAGIYESLRDFPTDNQGDTTVIVDKGNYTLIIETLERLVKNE